MDYRKIDFADPFVMVYGHMTKDGSMFGSLNAFKADGDVPSFEYSEREGHYRGAVSYTHLTLPTICSV